MIEVASLRYGVIFKKAFCVPEIFNAFIRDITGAMIEVDTVETEKSFSPAVGAVDVKYDLYAEDLKNRVIVDVQHERHNDHYDRFLYYGCVAIVEQIAKAKNYRPDLTVYTIVVLTSGDRHKEDITITDMDPKNKHGKSLGEISHKIIYITPKYVNEETPEAMKEWLMAIDDSLDEKVDEKAYQRPEIHKVFDLIQEGLITPKERAKMFEEYNQEERFQKGIAQGHQQMLIRQLCHKFTELPPAILEQIEETENIGQLEAWSDMSWDASALSDIDFGQK